MLGDYSHKIWGLGVYSPMNYPMLCFLTGFQLTGCRGKLNCQCDTICPSRRHDRYLFTPEYSRDMERQADILGTRLIASTGYAADSLRNSGCPRTAKIKVSYPASHPGSNERIRYLLIDAIDITARLWKGVARHARDKNKPENCWLRRNSGKRKASTIS